MKYRDKASFPPIPGATRSVEPWTHERKRWAAWRDDAYGFLF
jgi:hypothetical protein